MKPNISLCAFVCTIIFCIHLTPLFGQNYEKIIFDTDDQNGYYLAVMPKSAQINGVLVLLPGFGQPAESIFPESKIHNVAYLHNLLTIAIAGGEKLQADEGVVTKLDKALAHVKKQYGVKKAQFVMGGFSAGGTISLRYAEYCYENQSEAIILPQGVFNVDGPVDLFEIWAYFQRELKRNYSEVGVGEAQFVSALMQREIGDPVNDAARYDQLTPFNVKSNGPGNEKYLKDIGVRVYHDVDVVWQLRNRRRSLYDTNALVSSELINRLLLLGNTKAEFVPAKQPGVRSSGKRHPHSWSIVDEVEFVQWVNKLLKVQ